MTNLEPGMRSGSAGTFAAGRRPFTFFRSEVLSSACSACGAGRLALGVGLGGGSVSSDSPSDIEMVDEAPPFLDFGGTRDLALECAGDIDLGGAAGFEGGGMGDLALGGTGTLGLAGTGDLDMGGTRDLDLDGAGIFSSAGARASDMTTSPLSSMALASF